MNKKMEILNHHEGKAVENSLHQKKKSENTSGLSFKPLGDMNIRSVISCYGLNNNSIIQMNGEWVIVTKNVNYNNCTEYAFQGWVTLEFVNSLKKLKFLALKLKWSIATNTDSADVILYGKSGNYSYAIRKINGDWFEFYGNDERYWTGNSAPLKHGNDGIVLMLKEPKKKK